MGNGIWTHALPSCSLRDFLASLRMSLVLDWVLLNAMSCRDRQCLECEVIWSYIELLATIALCSYLLMPAPFTCLNASNWRFLLSFIDRNLSYLTYLLGNLELNGLKSPRFMLCVGKECKYDSCSWPSSCPSDGHEFKSCHSMSSSSSISCVNCFEIVVVMRRLLKSVLYLLRTDVSNLFIKEDAPLHERLLALQ